MLWEHVSDGYITDNERTGNGRTKRTCNVTLTLAAVAVRFLKGRRYAFYIEIGDIVEF